eukprot:1569303-Rhodomonas_salina.1
MCIRDSSLPPSLPPSLTCRPSLHRWEWRGVLCLAWLSARRLRYLLSYPSLPTSLPRHLPLPTSVPRHRDAYPCLTRSLVDT